MIALTPTQLTYLGALLGADVLPGVPDPFFGVLADEAEEALERARAFLIKRKLLTEQESGPPIANLGVGLMVGAICFPQSSLRLTLLPTEQEPLVIWYHITRNLSVSVMPVGEPPVCILQHYPDAAAIVQAILELLTERASLEIPGRSGAALQLTGSELLVDGPDGVERRESTPEAIQAAIESLVAAAWPKEVAAG